jgi:hypothetical protein
MGESAFRYYPSLWAARPGALDHLMPAQGNGPNLGGGGGWKEGSSA